MLQMTYNLAIWCIYMVFIDFQNFVNFRRKLADFGPKNRHFFADAAKILKNKIYGKVSIILWEMLQLV